MKIKLKVFNSCNVLDYVVYGQNGLNKRATESLRWPYLGNHKLKKNSALILIVSQVCCYGKKLSE